MGNGRLGTDASRVKTRRVNGGDVSADSWQVKQLLRRFGDGLMQCRVVGGEFCVESADAPAQSDGLDAADSQSGVVASGAPGRDGCDRRVGQSAAGFDAEIDDAQQRARRVNRANTLAGPLFTSRSSELVGRCGPPAAPASTAINVLCARQ